MLYSGLGHYLKVHQGSSFGIFSCDISETADESFGFNMIFGVVLVDVHVVYQTPAIQIILVLVVMVSKDTVLIEQQESWFAGID